MPVIDPAQRALLDRLGGLERERAVLYAREARVRAAMAELWGDDGGVLLELAGTARIGQRRATGQLTRAERLVQHFPIALGLLEHGVMFVGTVEVILAVTRNCSPQLQEQLDSELSEQLCTLDAADVRARLVRAIEQLEAELDAQAQRERHERARANRSVWVQPTQDGMARVGADLEQTDAHRWTLDFEELIRAQKLLDSRDGRVRTQAQRRADVFGELPSRLLALAGAAADGRLDALLTEHHATGSAPLLTPCTDGAPGTGQEAAVALAQRAERDADELLRQLLAVPLAKPATLHVHVPMTALLELDQRTGWVEGLGPVPAFRARMLLPTAALQRVAVDARTGIPLGIDPPTGPEPPWSFETDLTDAAGHSARARRHRDRLLRLLTPMSLTDRAEPQHDPSRALRRQVQIRDLSCDGPGCPRAATGCELDHEQAWADGGVTAQWNLRHRSTRCHHAKHRGWVVHRDPDTAGSTWISPAGSVFHRLSTWQPPPELPEDLALPEPRVEPPFIDTAEPYQLTLDEPLWPEPHPPRAPRPRSRRGAVPDDLDDLDAPGRPRSQPHPPRSVPKTWGDDGPPPF